jgi:hypothetical protein
MNATKRKFNALIQGIGSRAATPTDSEKPDAALRRPHSVHASTFSTSNAAAMAIDADLLAKRRRLGLAATTGANGANATATPIAGVVLRKWGKEGNATKAPASPKYCPSDRGELLRRLATFQELTDWTPKPEPVSEIEWAKRGWVCQGKERVRCTLCHKELVVGLNRKEVDGKEVPVLIPSEIGA